MPELGTQTETIEECYEDIRLIFGFVSHGFGSSARSLSTYALVGPPFSNVDESINHCDLQTTYGRALYTYCKHNGARMPSLKSTCPDSERQFMRSVRGETRRKLGAAVCIFTLDNQPVLLHKNCGESVALGLQDCTVLTNEGELQITQGVIYDLGIDRMSSIGRPEARGGFDKPTLYDASEGWLPSAQILRMSRFVVPWEVGLQDYYMHQKAGDGSGCGTFQLNLRGLDELRGRAEQFVEII